MSPNCWVVPIVARNGWTFATVICPFGNSNLSTERQIVYSKSNISWSCWWTAGTEEKKTVWSLTKSWVGNALQSDEICTDFNSVTEIVQVTIYCDQPFLNYVIWREIIRMHMYSLTEYKLLTLRCIHYKTFYFATLTVGN